MLAVAGILVNGCNLKLGMAVMLMRSTMCKLAAADVSSVHMLWQMVASQMASSMSVSMLPKQPLGSGDVVCIQCLCGVTLKRSLSPGFCP